ncbi:MAG: L-seryl-tRNA(Sec) selenium transferase [Verrucomicrobia bacterium]|nr:L-seryl-tRNA(Sec) selenium transferase [Verrucomicrobiota bacterium]
MSLRAIPQVEKVLQQLGDTGLPRPVVVAVVRRELAELRKHAAKTVIAPDDVIASIRSTLSTLRAQRIQPVINGTGIVVHTNFGRAPLGPHVLETLCEIGGNYNNLEYDLTGGARGGRAAYLELALAVLCGAEAATVVNNCAAALVLALRHFATGREVVISRGELVQIGGGFRIPEILEASGAKLREVGTTNKTTLNDYARAIGKETALILKVHRSNFFMGGFVESPSTEEIAALARKKRVPFIEDLGSGAVIETQRFGVEHEPTPAETLKRGVDLVTFSGDKLLGGPQAGIIAGRAKLVAALKKDPFFRALRCDKLILSALQTTADLYLNGEDSQVRLVTLLAEAREKLRARADGIVAALAGAPLKASAGVGRGQVGGGTLPRSQFESVTVDIVPRVPLEEFARRLRCHTPPVIGYVERGVFKLDLRTVFPAQDDTVVKAIKHAAT